MPVAVLNPDGLLYAKRTIQIEKVGSSSQAKGTTVLAGRWSER